LRCCMFPSRWEETSLPLSPFNASKLLVYAMVFPAVLWWTVWLLLPARTAGPLAEFPFGPAGFVTLAVMAVTVTGALLWRMARPSRPDETGTAMERRDVLCLALGALAILVFWEKVLVRGWMPINSIFLTYFHPLSALVNEYVQGGTPPLWNPWSNCGMPFMADPQIGALYPGNLPLYLWDFPTGFRVWLGLHVWMLFAFMYFWLRDRSLGPAAALFGGAAAALNGYAIYHVGYMSTFASLAWAPFLLHAWEKRRWTGLSAGAALQLLAGHPQFHYMTLLAIAALSLAQRPTWRLWGRTGLALAAGYALAAVQLFPAVELIRGSVRAGALSFSFATTFSQPPAQLAKMLFVPQWVHWRPETQGDPFIVVFYMGTVALLCAAWAVAKAPGRRTGPALGLLAFGALLSLGSHTPLYKPLFYALPGLNLFRYPGQWMGLVLIALTLLASEGVAALPTRAKGAAVALACLDLFIFSGWRASFIYVSPAFLHHQSPWLPALRASDGRFMVTRRLEDWRWNTPMDAGAPENPDFEPWMKLKEALLPNQGMPFHIREAKSFSNHIPRGIHAAQAAALREGAAGEPALRALGAKHLLDIDPAAGTALSPHFKMVQFPSGAPRLRGPSGEAVPVEVVGERPHALRLRLARAETDGSFVIGDGFAAGWRASAGGRPRLLEPYRGAFRRVFYKAGDTDIFLRYDPVSVLAGTLVSFAAALGFCLSGGRGVRRDLGFRRCLGAAAFLGGGVLLAKSLYDLTAGRPYANLFSPAPWAFVSIRQFVNFTLAELLCGAVGLLAGWLAVKAPDRAKEPHV